MKQTNFYTAMIAAALGLMTILGCSSLMPNSANQPTTSNTTAPNTVGSNSPSNIAEKKAEPEKADFTVTAEELDKEYTRKGVTDKDLAKYENKMIAVSGRVSMLVTEKKGTTQPWVTLYAPGTLHGVSCYFDDDNVGQMKKLQEDKMAKVQGFQNDFIVPEVSPRLEHCVVLD